MFGLLAASEAASQVRLHPVSLMPDVLVLRSGEQWLFSEYLSVPFSNFANRSIHFIEWKACNPLIPTANELLVVYAVCEHMCWFVMID